MVPYQGTGTPHGGSQGGWGAPQHPGYGPPGYPQQGAPQPPGPKKGSLALWVGLGCGGVALLSVLVIVALAVIGFSVGDQESSATPAPTGAGAQPTQPPNTNRFVNKRDGLKQDFIDNFVEFSLFYPQQWRLSPDPGKNFVRLALRREKTVGDTTTFRDIEVFSAGYFNVPLAQLDLSNFMPKGATKIDERSATVGSQEGKELRFKITTADGDTLWGRAIAVPATAAKDRGLLAFFLASESSPNVSGLDDVGKKGGLATILDSLRVGE